MTLAATSKGRARRVAATSKGRAWRVAAAAGSFLLVATLVAGLAPGSSRAAITLGLVSVKAGFTQPVAIASAGDGSGRLFVVEQAGRIRIIRNGPSIPLMRRFWRVAPSCSSPIRATRFGGCRAAGNSSGG